VNLNERGAALGQLEGQSTALAGRLVILDGDMQTGYPLATTVAGWCRPRASSKPQAIGWCKRAPSNCNGWRIATVNS